MSRRAMVPSPVAAGASYWITVLTPTHVHIRRHTAGALDLGDSYRMTFERNPGKAFRNAR